MAYADLQPKVFQYFREIGNAVIFALHFEQAMVCKSCFLSIKCNLETAKIGIRPWENMSSAIAKLPKSDFAHL